MDEDYKAADEVSNMEDRYPMKQTENGTLGEEKIFKKHIPIINHQREQKLHLDTGTE